MLGALVGLIACEPALEPATRALSPIFHAGDALPSEPATRATLGTATKSAPPASVSGAGPCVAGNCHTDLHQKEQRFRHKPYVDERCLDCHKNFHKQETQLARIQMELDLCYTCHTRQSLGNTHPVGEGVIDPNTKQTMTCTSTCHRSHTAPYRYLLTLPGEGALCVNCHKEFLK